MRLTTRINYSRFPSVLKNCAAVITAATFVSLPSIVSAQNVLEEIIVTAQKREMSVQNSPLSVSAYTGDELERQGIWNAEALSHLIPNLTIADDGLRDATIIAIRGISQSNTRASDDATTAFAIDGASVPNMGGVNAYFYDVERMEVLRGPQGTLWGQNSTSGVVNIITKKPNFDGYGGDIELGYGDYDDIRVKGAFNAPLSDTVATRFALNYNERDGYRENGSLVEDGDDADDFGFRGHMLWNISSDTSFLLSADYYEKRGTGRVINRVDCADKGCDVPGSTTPWKGTPLDEQGSVNNTQKNIKMELNHSFDSFDLFMLGSRRELERDTNRDSNALAGDDAIFDSPFGEVMLDGHFGEQMEHESWQGEVRLTSNDDSDLQWILGGYYLEETVDGDFSFIGPFGAPLFGPGTQNVHVQLDFKYQDMTKESQALFANASYDINDSWTIHGGIRYTEDDKDMGGNAADPINGTYQRLWVPAFNRNLGPGFPRAQIAEVSFSGTSSKLGLNWNINDDTMAYASYNRGYKAGGYNRGNDDGSSTIANVSNLLTYRPETVHAYEIGLKTTFLDGRARINMAAFFNDYTDKVETAGGFDANNQPTVTAVNASDVEIYGFELESSFLYGDSGGRVSFNLGWLDATYVDFKDLPDNDALSADPQPTKDVSGEQVHNAPDWNLSLNWVPMQLEVMDGMLTPMLTITYKSEYLNDPVGNYLNHVDAYTRSNASLHWESNTNSVYGEAYVRNIENENILVTGGCGTSTFSGSALGCTASYAAPRTYGVRVGYRF